MHVMDTNSPSDSDSADTNTRIDSNSSAANRSSDTANAAIPALSDSAIGHTGRSRFFDSEFDGAGVALDGFVADVTTIAQSQCEHATDYADIGSLVCDLLIGHCTFAAHDLSTSYSGPYPMAIQVRACLLTELNGWDDTALHDYLYAHPSLRQDLGFETLPNQSTFWRAWHHRFSEALCDAVRTCANSILTAAHRCDVALPDRITPNDSDDPGTDDCPNHQLVAETTDDVC
jgi:putative transposase